MSKNVFKCVVLIVIMKFSAIGNVVGQRYTAYAGGYALSTAPTDAFTYMGNSVSHYSLGWYSDNDASIYGPVAYLAGYGGVKFFSTGSMRMFISGDGTVSVGNRIYIGTVDANTPTRIAGYSLAVNGMALFNKATVKLYGNWPDYVFNKDFKIQNLNELEKFIHENHHLPDVPTAEQIAKDGINLGDNQMILLKKIEEITLLLIDQNKSLEKLKSEKLDQQKNIEDLQTKLKTLETNQAGFKK